MERGGRREEWKNASMKQNPSLVDLLLTSNSTQHLAELSTSSNPIPSKSLKESDDTQRCLQNVVEKLRRLDERTTESSSISRIAGVAPRSGESMDLLAIVVEDVIGSEGLGLEGLLDGVHLRRMEKASWRREERG